MQTYKLIPIVRPSNRIPLCLPPEGGEGGGLADEKDKKDKKDKKDNLEDQKRCVFNCKLVFNCKPKKTKKPTWEQGKPVFSQCLRIYKLNPFVWLSNKILLWGITN